MNLISIFFSNLLVLNSPFQLAFLIVLAYLALLWIALIIWVTRDSLNRSESLFFQILSIVLVISLNFFGVLIYLIIRPHQTLEQKYLTLVDQETIDAEYEDEIIKCPRCESVSHKDFFFCPQCGHQLKIKCAKCHKPVQVNWKNCPFCGIGAEVSIKKKLSVKNEKSKEKEPASNLKAKK